MGEVAISWIYAAMDFAVQCFGAIVTSTGLYWFMLVNFCFIMAVVYFLFPLVASAGRSDKARRKDDD